MYAKNNHPSIGLPPEPGFSSGAFALQTTDLKEQATARTNMTHQIAPQRVKPNIPQKKTHVDEMYRLKKLLDEAIIARDEAIQVKDMMADDLITAQEEAAGKDSELKKASNELAAWREQAKTLSKQMKQQEPSSASTGQVNGKREVELQQQIMQLTTALAEKDATLNNQASTMAESQSRSEFSIFEAQQRFNAELKQMRDDFHNQLRAEQRSRQLAEAELHNQHNTHLRETRELADAQIEEEKKRVQAMELTMNDQMNRMEIDSTSQQNHEQVIAKQEEEIHNQRQRCSQFRRTSERLTSQIKQAVDEKRALERSDQEMRQQFEDMKSQIAALRLQLRDYRMPGSFSEEQPSYRFS